MNSRKKGMTLVAKQRTAGWLFLAPASIMIAVMSFYPMIRAFIISLQTGAGANMRFADPIFSNYKRILADKVFQQSIVNTFLYLIIQVPIMLILAILLAQLLNNKDLKLRGFFRTCVFLPCATSLVSYSLIFRSMFATDGLINSILIKLGILSTGYNFLGNSTSAKIVIILALIWRWTGYNMVFYLAGLQKSMTSSSVRSSGSCRKLSSIPPRVQSRCVRSFRVSCFNWCCNAFSDRKSVV